MRPPPESDEESIYLRLIPLMSRAGRRVDLDGLAELAAAIQQHGHKCGRAKYMAKVLGLDPDYLPRRRTP